MISHFIVALLAMPVQSFFFDFGGHQAQQQAQQQTTSYEDSVLNSECKDYVCPQTQECVQGPEACPCPFPRSQLRCVLPNKHVVCISKPATNDKKLNDVYDDPVKGPRARNKGLRDCGWVEAAYKGLV
ncbi:AaceriAGR072Wp [[Ashbya] aceris (nom. inval.)]|nr:AaceriAGR072Wp [[Ashbya] aceris (nom. inval.)]